MYAFFGALTTLISIITKLLAFYAIPGERPWESTFAVAFSWVCAVTFAFFTNKKYVFKNETQSKNEFWKVFVSFYGARGITFLQKKQFFLYFTIGLDLVKLL